MAKIKVKNVGNSLVIVPNERGGDILIPPQNEAEIEERYLPHFSGKLIKVKEDKSEENIKEETSEQEWTQPVQESTEEVQVQEPTEEGTEPVEEQPVEEKPKRGRRR